MQNIYRSKYFYLSWTVRKELETGLKLSRYYWSTPRWIFVIVSTLSICKIVKFIIGARDHIYFPKSMKMPFLIISNLQIIFFILSLVWASSHILIVQVVIFDIRIRTASAYHPACTHPWFFIIRHRLQHRHRKHLHLLLGMCLSLRSPLSVWSTTDVAGTANLRDDISILAATEGRHPGRSPHYRGRPQSVIGIL